MDFSDKNCLVCGMAVSGQAAARLLKKLGASVTAQDKNDFDKINWTFLPEEEGIHIFMGKNPDDIVDGFDLIVLSPGIPADLPFVKKAQRLGIPVWGEIELAYRLCPCPIIAITGTNGKTTVTTLVGEIMRKVRPTLVAGNIGVPFTEQVLSLTPQHIVVAEVSSFQLETIVQFRPYISAILNITPDHLDRHKTMQAYAAMKERIFENQTADDFVVLNGDDPYCKAMCPPGRVVYFNESDMDTTPYKTMRDNVLAAVAIARLAGVPMPVILQVLADFKGVEHRLEYVATLGGVDYFNDSKATNPDSATKALHAMKRPVVLIGGGYDKNADFDDWVSLFEGRVKHLIVMGQTADAIIKSCQAHGFTSYQRVNALRDAVSVAISRAKDGDAVLLSPACASWDMFDNFEQRGSLFKQFVFEMGGHA